MSYPVSAIAGQRSQVTIRMPAQDAPVSASTPAQTTLVGPEGDSTWQRPVGIVGLAVGATCLLASGVTAAVALDRRSELGRTCPGGRCPPSEHNELRVYERFKTASALTFYSGLLSGTAGLILLLVEPEPKEQKPRVDRLAVELGPTSIQLRGVL